MKAGNSAGSRRAIAHAFRGISRTELVYLEDSPNYCIKNQSLGVQGTEGRECLKGHRNISQWERRSCRRLCYECGLRVVERRTEVVSSCNCKFHWCCTVKCERCTQVVTKYYCARKDGGRGWLWGGCSDNLDFGERISKQYVDAQETGQDSRAAVNLHNNAAGRTAVKATVKRICRCHGMSESCSLQTCWTQLSDFREIGNYLKIKYNQARKLDIDKKRVRAGNSADSRGAIVDAFGHVAQTELIYMEDSPDYCRRNASLGLHGTEGRECLQHGADLTQWERRSCRRLCHECGLRVEERRTEVVSSCNCKFHWCCRVNCEDCSEIIVKHVCAKKEVSEGYTFRRRHIGPK
ncbi:Protein Wnt-8c [Goodea atripinnis]|uniref:Protein Wnt n=1 Tax=Goodea atripinnis TaxID=208336 RepID=A0ABV0PXM1_9TELE